MVINLFPCLSHSFSALSSIITSLLSSPPSCFLPVSQSKSSLLQSRFSIQSPSPILPCLFSSVLFVFGHSFVLHSTPLKPLHPSALCHTDCFVRHPQSRWSPPPMLPHCPCDLLKLYQCGRTRGDGWPPGPLLIWSLAFMPRSTRLFACCHFSVRLFLIWTLFSEPEAEQCDLSSLLFVTVIYEVQRPLEYMKYNQKYISQDNK